MSNNKQSSVEWLIETFKLTNVDLSHHRLIIEQARVMQQEQAQQYAEFCVECDRRNLPLLDFNSWIAHNETFNNEQ